MRPLNDVFLRFEHVKFQNINSNHLVFGDHDRWKQNENNSVDVLMTFALMLNSLCFPSFNRRNKNCIWFQNCKHFKCVVWKDWVILEKCHVLRSLQCSAFRPLTLFVFAFLSILSTLNSSWHFNSNEWQCLFTRLFIHSFFVESTNANDYWEVQQNAQHSKEYKNIRWCNGSCVVNFIVSFKSNAGSFHWKICVLGAFWVVLGIWFSAHKKSPCCTDNISIEFCESWVWFFRSEKYQNYN